MSAPLVVPVVFVSGAKSLRVLVLFSGFVFPVRFVECWIILYMETFLVKIVSACKSMLFRETRKTGKSALRAKRGDEGGLEYKNGSVVYCKALFSEMLKFLKNYLTGFVPAV